MTPFKIRKRLKALLGLGQESEEARPPLRSKVVLRVVDDGGMEQSFEGHEGDTVLFVSGNMEKPIGSGCNDSTCATCRVEVLDGAEYLSPQGDHECKTLRENQHPEHLRLACCAEILRDSVHVRAFEFLEL